MTKLEEIQARADAATDGPWAAAKSADGYGKKVLGPRRAGDLGQGLVTLMKPIFWNTESARNAEFIAHARQDVPKLVTALRAVEAAMDDLDTARAEGRIHTYGQIQRAVRTVIQEALGA